LRKGNTGGAGKGVTRRGGTAQEKTIKKKVQGSARQLKRIRKSNGIKMGPPGVRDNLLLTAERETQTGQERRKRKKGRTVMLRTGRGAQRPLEARRRGGS